MAALGCLSVCPPSVQAGCPVLGLAVGLSSSQDTGSYPTTPSSFPIPRPTLPVRGGGALLGMWLRSPAGVSGLLLAACPAALCAHYSLLSAGEPVIPRTSETIFRRFLFIY